MSNADAAATATLPVRRRLSLRAFWPVVLLSLLILSASRAALMLWQSDLLPEGSVLYILGMGLRYDIASVLALFALPCLLVLVCSLINFLPRLLLWVVKVYCAAALAFLVMNEAATPGFILEYGVRPNHLYVQYLIHPMEVIRTLWGGHKVELLLSLLVTCGTFAGGYILQGWCFSRDLARQQHRQSPVPRKILALQILLLLLITPMGIRSTFGHRPLNPAMAAFCESPLVNTLPVNSSYMAAYALTHLGDTKLSKDDIYALVPAEQVLSAARTLSAVTPAPATDSCPLLQRIEPVPAAAGQMRNVVIVLEESMGADFVQSLGGRPVTPELERLKEKGWWFENLYAAGHRSIRGIEAVSAGFPPSPMDSIVKLPQPSGPYATLAQIYKNKGYHTSFIYGGESYFDNMRSYFLSNGAEEVIEQKDYKNPQFVASWGVSDEDLFARAQQSFEADYAAGRPFFAVVFTSSFHDPFDIPQGKVSLDFDAGAETERLLAVKYADYALGKFMDKALSSEYARNTVFLIVADHESKVRARGSFPWNKFRIPGLIFAPQLPPRSDSRLVSQIDLPPTLLSLSGFAGTVPFVGQNLLRDDIKERAMLQYNEIFGLLTPHSLTVLTPGKAADVFSRDAQGAMHKTEADEAMVQQAAALENLGPLLYQKGYMSERCVSAD